MNDVIFSCLQATVMVDTTVPPLSATLTRSRTADTEDTATVSAATAATVSADTAVSDTTAITKLTSTTSNFLILFFLQHLFKYS